MMAGGRSLTQTGAPLADLEVAAVDRLEDAEVLLLGKRYASAILHGFYALEIRLKIVICRRLQIQDLPRIFETHDLGGLMLHTGLSRKILKVKRPRLVSKNWGELLELSEKLQEVRYRPDPNTWDRERAERVLHLLRDTPNGVLPWLVKQASIKSR